MESIKALWEDLDIWIGTPSITISDVIEVLLLAFVIYHVIKWIRDTRAFTLVKGMAILFLFSLVAVVLNLDVVLWILSHTFSVGITALLILFQPELRRALDELGRRNLIPQILINKDDESIRFSNRTVDELLHATVTLAHQKTGALIVIERQVRLGEYERTGIKLDAEVSSQLLINIFEKNTPLHDGAVVMRGDRITTATCYLPLSANMEVSKELGTRHRAALGVSEQTDSVTIVVSEETGKISVAEEGKLRMGLSEDQLRRVLTAVQKRAISDEEKSTGYLDSVVSFFSRPLEQKEQEPKKKKGSKR